MLLSNFLAILDDIIAAGHGSAILNLRDQEDSFYTISSVDLIAYCDEASDSIVRISTLPSPALSVLAVRDRAECCVDGRVEVYNPSDGMQYVPLKRWTVEDDLVILDVDTPKVDPASLERLDELERWLRVYKTHNYRGVLSPELVETIECLLRKMRK